MRCLGFYWLQCQFMLEEIREEYGFILAFVLFLSILCFIEALKKVLMGL